MGHVTGLALLWAVLLPVISGRGLPLRSWMDEGLSFVVFLTAGLEGY